MRVIAGSAGGIPLKVPAHDLRPTMDRVRGAIFSSLGDRVPEARVLDLFAGSGGFGIEALSRGASAAALVDHHLKSVEAIRDNLAKARLHGVVHREDVFHFLRRTEDRFDLIFADPPYAQRELMVELLAEPKLVEVLAPGGLFVLESSIQPLFPQEWSLLKSKKYGKTLVFFLAAS